MHDWNQARAIIVDASATKCRCVRVSCYCPVSQSKCSAGDSQTWHQVQGCVIKEAFTAEGNAYSFSFLSQAFDLVLWMFAALWLEMMVLCSSLTKMPLGQGPSSLSHYRASCSKPPAVGAAGVSYAQKGRGKKTGSLLEDFGTLEFEGHQEHSPLRAPSGDLENPEDTQKNGSNN